MALSADGTGATATDGEDGAIKVEFASGNTYTILPNGTINQGANGGGGSNPTPTDPEEPDDPTPPSGGLGVGNVATSDGQTVNGEAASYSNPIIPKGFKAINEGSATWGTANGYQNGLVIEDAVTGSETIGSQFVWVPVLTYSNFHLIEGYFNRKLTIKAK